MIDMWIDAVAGADAADWVTVAFYLVVAVLAARAGGHARDARRDHEKRCWLIVAVAMTLLGINELLDLQALLTDLGRDYAKAHGWYGRHRQVQYVFVLVLAGSAGVLAVLTLWLTRRMAGSVRLALAGMIFIGLFVLLRAASFHHVDDFLGQGPQPFNLASMQELAGIAIVAAAALLYARARKREWRSRHPARTRRL